jgi:hypothetical protein
MELRNDKVEIASMDTPVKPIHADAGGLQARRGFAVAPLRPVKSPSKHIKSRNEKEIGCSEHDAGNAKPKGCKVETKEELKEASVKKVNGTTLVCPEVTTLMIRNLPFTLTLSELLNALETSGFKSQCDYCYLPHKFQNHTNQGFAFVNFANAEVAQKFLSEWQGSTLFRTECMRKSLNISAAAVQGRAANFKASTRKLGRVKNPSFRPWVPDGVCLRAD